MTNVLRVLMKIRMERGRPKGWRNRDIKRLMELSKFLWLSFCRRYNVRWVKKEIIESL